MPPCHEIFAFKFSNTREPRSCEFKSTWILLRYTSREEFAADSRLVFDNCNHYNEDDSEVMKQRESWDEVVFRRPERGQLLRRVALCSARLGIISSCDSLVMHYGIISNPLNACPLYKFIGCEDRKNVYFHSTLIFGPLSLACLYAVYLYVCI